MGRHPNFYGVVVVGLGCERLRTHEVAESIAGAGKPVKVVRAVSEEVAQDILATIERMEAQLPPLRLDFVGQ
ncbi:MAG: UxaA family hydrolase [Thermanaeromonas sp.]|uniref:UxaA family hydrolase n=1 Tax=Thermanaeromonas sp. TaxID=2003697 RepID=UPI0024378822|nr:UxaA family hydrolase [Thermanaeromonas sp.]